MNEGSASWKLMVATALALASLRCTGDDAAAPSTQASQDGAVVDTGPRPSDASRQGGLDGGTGGRGASAAPDSGFTSGGAGSTAPGFLGDCMTPPAVWHSAVEDACTACMIGTCCRELNRCHGQQWALGGEGSCDGRLRCIALCLEPQIDGDWSAASADLIAACAQQCLNVPEATPEESREGHVISMTNAFECVLHAPAVVAAGENDAGIRWTLAVEDGDAGTDDDAGTGMEPGLGCFAQCGLPPDDE